MENLKQENSEKFKHSYGPQILLVVSFAVWLTFTFQNSRFTEIIWQWILIQNETL